MTGRARTWTDGDLERAIAAAGSWCEVLAQLDLGAARSNTSRLRGHAARLGLDVSHLGPVIDTETVDSPPPLDREAVCAAVASSDTWAEALRKLGLSRNSRGYKRVQAIAKNAWIIPRKPELVDVIADFTMPEVPFPPPVTVRKGTCTEGAVLNALLACGYNVLIPFGVARYDLVIEVIDGFRRVQCKTGRLVRAEVMEFNVCSFSPEGVKRGYAGQIDFFGVHLPPWTVCT